MSSQLESAFATIWRAKAPKSLAYVREHQFALEAFGRKWQLDFAWPSYLVAVEMEGGIFTGGGHTRGKHYTSDCQKYNAAVMLGWKVLRYTTLDMKERPVVCVEEVLELLAMVPRQEQPA